MVVPETMMVPVSIIINTHSFWILFIKPFANGEISSLGLDLEWKRFTTWNMTDYMKSEIQLLKELTPGIPVTTNFMGLYGGLLVNSYNGYA